MSVKIHLPEKAAEPDYSGRRRVLLSLFLLVAVTLVGRAFALQVLDKDFLQHQADIRHMRVIPVPAHRGKILDRNGDAIAISTPVQSVWINPGEFVASLGQKKVLAQLLSISEKRITRLSTEGHKRFAYLKRRIEPALAEQVAALDLPGLYFQTEYRRYYPAGEVAAQLVGFTNIDDAGQEGLELAYEGWLNGEDGRKRVVRDGKKRIIEDVELLQPAEAGKDLALSIDLDMQYLAYRELKAAVKKHRAKSGSLVLLDVKTGEVLAMVSQPSFNPNSAKKSGSRRNRAVTDVFEPGSTMKPFAVACGLENGVISANSTINTSPGHYSIGRYQISDHGKHGLMSVSRILEKSSNVGVSKIALRLNPEQLWACYDQLGFGRATAAGFPGETSGRLSDYSRWHRIEQATMSYGYGLSASTLQLARAYAALANGGRLPDVTYLKRTEAVNGEPVFSASTIAPLQLMLEKVVGDKGTAPLARVNGYRVAGKTGTVKKSGAGGYADNRYQTLFAGFAPVSNPRLAMAVIIDDPAGEQYYGGQVAAPVFSKVMAGVLRLSATKPDLEADMFQVGTARRQAL
jgi:cell division protein FtsI (penicillin-binding protein 3)